MNTYRKGMEVQLTILDVGTRWCGQFHVPTTLTPPPPAGTKATVLRIQIHVAILKPHLRFLGVLLKFTKYGNTIFTRILVRKPSVTK
jgi:hypothetical protein